MLVIGPKHLRVRLFVSVDDLMIAFSLAAGLQSFLFSWSCDASEISAQGTGRKWSKCRHEGLAPWVGNILNF